MLISTNPGRVLRFEALLEKKGQTGLGSFQKEVFLGSKVFGVPGRKGTWLIFFLGLLVSFGCSIPSGSC